ncbi:PopZ family protein [Mesorhizobium sp. ANAO-SY3R2]|uniref:PopZ family protein n=1 Tax=Mesorhizobium sp. ANAO-SY3R2 TaxID=3166644 RepID=UPI00367060F7
MAQASSVQREPSMEEILASIRRIIEDNDTGRRPAIDFEQMRPEPENDGTDRNVIEVEAFRAELQATKVPAAEVKAERPVEKSDSANRDTPIAAAWPVLEPTKAPALEPTMPAVESKDAPRVLAASWTPSSTRAVEQMEELAGPEPEKAPAPLAADPAIGEERPAAKAAILSEQAGRQVSAAFGELNDAYAARSRKSFDEIAAEMMRPMLQDWLDNNLPTLVEKLVREEIERVARGA